MYPSRRITKGLLSRAAALLSAAVCFFLAGCDIGPTPNPYLADPLYAITHFDSSQSDSTPYGPPRGTFNIDPEQQQFSPGGPVNIMTLASTRKDYMWAVGSDRVSYVHTGFGDFTVQATFEGFADAFDNASSVPDENFQTFAAATAAGMDAVSMDSQLKSLFGENYKLRFGNGIYSVVDKDNVLYTNYGDNLYALALADPLKPSDGIQVLYKIEGIVATIQAGSGPIPAGTRLFGLSMTYDGHLIITFSNGVAVIDRTLDVASAAFYRFADNEYVSNSLAVDEQNGIYIASNKIMRKLVWTGATLSGTESDGAWSSPYESSTELPPIIKIGNGTGATPTLMGFDRDADKLVVITDGTKQMKLLAFWRDAIPEDFVQKPGTVSRRIAGQIQVTCGFSPAPEWIQSEQSVVVNGYGAFVVNNIPQTIADAIKNANRILQVSLMGPAYPACLGVERLQWDAAAHEWASVWTRPDISSTSMVPVHSASGRMALVNGYTDADGWEVTGLDWTTGKTVHRTIFGNQNFGNGAYAIVQYLKNGDLLFNSFAGPFRVQYGK